MLKFWYSEHILDKYRVMYFEVVDLFINSLKAGFEQETSHVSSLIEDFLLSSIKDENIIEDEDKKLLMEKYFDDLDMQSLFVELPIL